MVPFIIVVQPDRCQQKMSATMLGDEVDNIRSRSSLLQEVQSVSMNLDLLDLVGELTHH